MLIKHLLIIFLDVNLSEKIEKLSIYQLWNSFDTFHMCRYTKQQLFNIYEHHLAGLQNLHLSSQETNCCCDVSSPHSIFWRGEVLGVNVMLT